MISDELFRELYSTGRSLYSIEKETGTNCSTLAKQCRRLGLPVRDNRKAKNGPVKDRLPEVLALFKEGKERGEIARILECDHSTISRMLKKQGLGGNVNNKTHAVDETFFERIDTEAKSYTLGFFTADGCNRGNTMQISVTDRDVVEKIRDTMGFAGPIHEIPPRTPSRQVQYRINVCSTKICDDLTRLDCPPRKSFVTRFPGPDQVPPHLLVHYIRGVFDGDGSLYKTHGKWNVCIAGSEALLVPMLAFIREQTNIYTGGVYKHGKIKILRIPGDNSVRILLRWLYRDATIYLDRKFALYQSM